MDWTVAGRLVLSAVLSGMVGLERAWREKPAGLRTHVLVCMGSTLIMLVSIRMGDLVPGTIDPSRIASNVVAGLGFLGAGTIIHSQGSVRGLTTAAGLWAVGAIGLAIGCGFYQGALLTWLLMLIVLHVLDRIERYLVHRAGPRLRSNLKRWLAGDEE